MVRKSDMSLQSSTKRLLLDVVFEIILRLRFIIGTSLNNFSNDGSELETFLLV